MLYIYSAHTHTDTHADIHIKILTSPCNTHTITSQHAQGYEGMNGRSTEHDGRTVGQKACIPEPVNDRPYAKKRGKRTSDSSSSSSSFEFGRPLDVRAPVM